MFPLTARLWCKEKAFHVLVFVYLALSLSLWERSVLNIEGLPHRVCLSEWLSKKRTHTHTLGPSRLRPLVCLTTAATAAAAAVAFEWRVISVDNGRGGTKPNIYSSAFLKHILPKGFHTRKYWFFPPLKFKVFVNLPQTCLNRLKTIQRQNTCF